MLVEPLADADVNVPGVMAILVAPAAAQLSVLLVPEFTLVGSAVKEVIVGTEPFPGGELDEVEPQSTSPTQANRMRTSAQRSSPEELSPRDLSLFLQNELVESMRNPKEVGYTAWRTLLDSCAEGIVLERHRAWHHCLDQPDLEVPRARLPARIGQRVAVRVIRVAAARCRDQVVRWVIVILTHPQ